MLGARKLFAKFFLLPACLLNGQDAREVASSVQEKIDGLPQGFEEKEQEDVKDGAMPHNGGPSQGGPPEKLMRYGDT